MRRTALGDAIKTGMSTMRERAGACACPAAVRAVADRTARQLSHMDVGPFHDHSMTTILCAADLAIALLEQSDYALTI